MIWSRLRAAAVGETAGLRVPMPAGLGCCRVCRGPSRAGYPLCFSCSLHQRIAPGLLADAVVPLSYSIAGTAYCRWLRMYKSASAERREARAAIRTLLLVFLHDHGSCLWASAGMTAPSHVAAVPSGCGRAGVHPLRMLIEPYLALPWAGLIACGDDPVQPRELWIGRYRSASSLRDANVLPARRHVGLRRERAVGCRGAEAGRRRVRGDARIRTARQCGAPAFRYIPACSLPKLLPARSLRRPHCGTAGSGPGTRVRRLTVTRREPLVPPTVSG